VEHLRAILVYVVGVLLALCGLVLLAGAGGDNGHAATYIELRGQHVSTPVAGLVSLLLAALVVALGAGRRGLGSSSRVAGHS
jgi:drug/metabolite transporter (DMT)-like permease